MLTCKSVLAVIPARSGSKGVTDKNIRELAGRSLIGRAASTVLSCEWIDRAVLSTDSESYLREAERHGVTAPGLRPKQLATDSSGVIDAIVQSLDSAERQDSRTYDLVLIVEPSSPFRRPADLLSCATKLIESNASSCVTVSEVPSKAHPDKVFTLVDGRLGFYSERCGSVVNRQELATLYSRNGVCYALTRECVLERRIITEGDTVACVTDHVVANIDEPLDLTWAEFLIERGLWSDVEEGKATRT